MAFNKVVPTKVSSYKIFNVDNGEELEKVANIKLPANFEYDPDFLYLLVRIVSSGQYYGPNKNGDYFPTQELEAAYETFADAHPFQEHRNKDVANSLGHIVSFEWNDVMKTVEVLKAIDRKKAPEIVRGYEKGYMTDVSMGCRVPYTVCSVCGNKASKRSQFCDHVKMHRNKFLGNGERVFEINYKPKFHDSSVVLSGAERSAKAVFVLNEEDFGDEALFSKTASADGRVFEYTPLSQPEMDKIASHKAEHVHPILQKETIEKTARLEGNELLQKLAAIEKEVTGKILGVATASESYNKPVEKFIEIIRFMGDGRLTESADVISETLNELADSRGVSRCTAFNAFLSVAELMGIALYPTEIDEIAKGMTFGDNPAFGLTKVEGEVTPSNYLANTGNGVFEMLESLPALDHPSKILTMYEQAPLYEEIISEKPETFIRIINETPVPNDPIPSGFTDVIRELLEPARPVRSAFDSNLHSRLLSSLGGGKVLLKPKMEATQDLFTITQPSSLGDLLSAIAFTNHNRMRPDISTSGLTKTASFYDSSLQQSSDSKVAEIYNKPLLSKEASLRPYNLGDSTTLKMIVKQASPIDSGNFNAFNDEFMEHYANYIGDDEKASAIATASLLEMGGHDKEASLLKNEYKIPQVFVDGFIKKAYDYTSNELYKAANDLNEVIVTDSFNTDNLTKEASAMEEALKDDLFFRHVTKYF